MRNLCLAAVTLLLAHHGASAFSTGPLSKGISSVSSFTPGVLSRRSPRSNRINTGLSMVIERLSDECVGAILTAHNIGNDIGLDVLRNEILFAGIVGKPERAAPTLEKYRMDYDKVKETAIAQVRRSVSSLTEGGNESKEALPFSAASKLVLEQALTISDRFNSPSVRSEHVLLALMGYNNGMPIESAPGLDVLSNMPSLKGLDGKGFSCFKFCEQLVQDLEQQPDSNVETGSGPRAREEVVINGGGLGLGSATLSSVGVDLTQMALEGKLDNVYGRDDEIRSALRTLGRRRKNNPCLVGGKLLSSLVALVVIFWLTRVALLQNLVSERLLLLKLLPKSWPQPFLTNRKRRSSNFPLAIHLEIRMVTTRRMKPQPMRLSTLCQLVLPLSRALVSLALNSQAWSLEPPTEEISKRGFRISSKKPLAPTLFFSSTKFTILSELVEEGMGTYYFCFMVLSILPASHKVPLSVLRSAMNAANLLKPALARGELRILGATTTPEYRRYIEKDGALERRFQPLEIKEPTVDQTIDILATIMPRYEEFHGVEYTSNALVAAAKLSDRYVSDRFLPDKAIDLLDEAGSMIKMLEDEENFFVTEDAVTAVISEMSGIPIGRLDTGEKTRLQNLEAEIGKRIKGQEQAVRAVSKAIRRSRSGMRDARRPVSSFLFVGPTGVGKFNFPRPSSWRYRF